MFDSRSSATEMLIDAAAALPHADFRTPAEPEAGWAARNPDRAMLFLFVSPRDCGALDELMAL
ncbi:MAG: hypothetical protein QOI38_1945 [Sphingomonadales bacterium]|jgi:hypothetical protein|nr:hypothetical protein [Sphingomonadales bacterium]